MIKKIKNILALTILAALSISCSMALLNDDETVLDGEFAIAVNGVVSDVVTNAPLKDIQVTFSAFATNSLSVMPLVSKTVTTDTDGTYSFKILGFSDPVTCTITAESIVEAENQYEAMTNEIVVTWEGNSYDPERKTFFVNDCNFQMEKKD